MHLVKSSAEAFQKFTGSCTDCDWVFFKHQCAHFQSTTVKPFKSLTLQCGSNFVFCFSENLKPVSFSKALNVGGCLKGAFHGQFGSRKCLWLGCLSKQLVMVLAWGELFLTHTEKEKLGCYFQHSCCMYRITCKHACVLWSTFLIQMFWRQQICRPVTDTNFLLRYFT